VIPLGYFDGIHDCFSNKGSVLIHGQPAPILGKVCMDFFMVSLREIPTARVHDPILIFGEDSSGYTQSAESFAQQGGVSVYQLITCLGPRIQRVFAYDAQARELVTQFKDPHVKKREIQKTDANTKR
jgi:alanine racemase/UDP-N-acetylmuramoyl-tripeptide--D-alanyl-D-alanine ligase